MTILLKYVLKNMKEKKFRLFLILISIILSSALFFASTSISENVAQIYSKQMRTYSGESDISIYPSKDARSLYFDTNNFEAIENLTDYIVGTIGGSGVYKGIDNQEQRISIFGTGLEDLEKYNPIYLSKTLEGHSFTGKAIIINSTFAGKNHFDIGDYVEIQMGNGYSYRWLVWGIADPQGLLRDDGFQTTIVAPSDTISRLYGVPGKIDRAYISVNNNQAEKMNIQKTIDLLKAELPGFEVEESLSEDELREAIAQIATIFQIMLVLVIFISVYIIYSSFKVMMAERLPVIGTFRSIGATKRSTNFIMLLESLMYGVVGGTLGSGLGIIVLKIMTDQMAYDPYSGIKSEVQLYFSAFNVLSTLGMAIILAVISSLIPIVQASKMPIKEIVLDKASKLVAQKKFRPIIGGMIMLVSILIPMTQIFARSMLVNLSCMVTSIIGLVLLLPLVTEFFVFVFEKVFVIFGNNGALAVKNLKGNKSIQGNIILLSIGIASLIMINIISYSVSVEVVNVYNEGDFELWSSIGQMNREALSQVISVEGVEDAYGVYSTYEVPFVGKDGNLGSLYGIDARKFFDYWHYDISGDQQSVITQLDQGRNIILNKSMAEKFDYQVGDDVVLTLNSRERNYRLIGLTNTLMNNGQIGFISDKYFKNDIGGEYYNDIYIRTEEAPELVNQRVLDKFIRRGVWSETKAKLQESNQKSNDQIFVMLQGFSILTMVIGIFGVFNNYLVSMLHRKRAFAMYRSVGMSRQMLRRMLYLESFACGIIGGLAGIAGGLLFVHMVSYMLIAMDLPVAMHINKTLLLQALLGGILVSIIASISPVLQSSKMSIIQAVKYE